MIRNHPNNEIIICKSCLNFTLIQLAKESNVRSHGVFFTHSWMKTITPVNDSQDDRSHTRSSWLCPENSQTGLQNMILNPMSEWGPRTATRKYVTDYMQTWTLLTINDTYYYHIKVIYQNIEEPLPFCL